MPEYNQQWLPYLGDAVAVRTGDRDLMGTVTRYDAALVEIQATGMREGDAVEVAWQVGAAVHRCTGRVESTSDERFSVRLAAAPAQASRRTYERVSLSVRVAVSSRHSGGVPYQGRTLDLSDGGLRALLASDTRFPVGQAVRVEVELGGRVEVLEASVVWENPHGAGERLAGLAFATPVDTGTWRGLSQHAF